MSIENRRALLRAGMPKISLPVVAVGNRDYGSPTSKDAENRAYG